MAPITTLAIIHPGTRLIIIIPGLALITVGVAVMAATTLTGVAVMAGMPGVKRAMATFMDTIAIHGGITGATAVTGVTRT